jgi:hypothetical protein
MSQFAQPQYPRMNQFAQPQVSQMGQFAQFQGPQMSQFAQPQAQLSTTMDQFAQRPQIGSPPPQGYQLGTTRQDSQSDKIILHFFFKKNAIRSGFDRKLHIR